MVPGLRTELLEYALSGMNATRVKKIKQRKKAQSTLIKTRVPRPSQEKQSQQGALVVL